jgi:hypothetical protein
MSFLRLMGSRAAISQSAPGHWLPWGRFPEAVRTGRHQVTAAHEEASIFDYFSRHPDEASFFTESMSNLSRAAARDIAAVLDTKGTTLALDIGGASGDVIRAMMRANPELNGGVLDLPHVVPAATEAAKAEGLDGRFATATGDFFESVPAADLYVLKYILHDRDDASCVRILQNGPGLHRRGASVAGAVVPGPVVHHARLRRLHAARPGGERAASWQWVRGHPVQCVPGGVPPARPARSAAAVMLWSMPPKTMP